MPLSFRFTTEPDTAAQKDSRVGTDTSPGAVGSLGGLSGAQGNAWGARKPLDQERMRCGL